MPTLTRNQRRQIAQEKQDMPFVDVHEVSGEPQEAKAEDEPPLPASVPNHKDEEGTRRRRGHKHSSTTSKRNRVASESLEESTEDSDTATSDDQGTGNHRRRKHNPNQNGSHSLMKTTPGTQNRTNEMTTTTGDASKDKPQANWWRRFWTTWVMIGSWFLLIYQFKQLGIILLVLLVQANIYRELVTIAIRFNKEKQLPGFNFFYYYWFVVFVYFIYSRTLMPHFENHSLLIKSGGIISSILRNHVIISFMLYCAGFIGFVVSLRKKKLYRYQFSQFAYCHVALFMVVWQSTFLVANVFQGLIWMVLPASLVVCNDIFAYVFGRLMGRTPLIRLSPKKTWEGFIGAFIATVVWAFLFTRLLETRSELGTNKLMLCPKLGFNPFEEPSCDVNVVHGGIHLYYPLQEWWFGTVVPRALAHWEISEMQLHSIVMAIFASVVAPFGGFFASGFKRAFKIKDFGESIPGHGGFTDRMDCQIVMGSFAYIYCWHLLRLSDQTELVPEATLQYLLKRSLQLSPEQKQELVNQLQESFY